VEQQHGLRWAVRMARSWSARLGFDAAAMLATMASGDLVARKAASHVVTYLALGDVLDGQPDAWLAPLTDMLRAGEAAAADVLLAVAPGAWTAAATAPAAAACGRRGARGRRRPWRACRRRLPPALAAGAAVLEKLGGSLVFLLSHDLSACAAVVGQFSAGPVKGRVHRPWRRHACAVPEGAGRVGGRRPRRPILSRADKITFLLM
jgi:hypothetical protein